jgi:MEMO1 family protein
MRDATGRLRRSAVAGSWYPGTAASIVAEVEGYLGEARAPKPAGRLIGLISPHAGLRYSGPVAAHGYALLAGRSNLTVVLVGPSHRYRFDGVALWARGGFETPLGVTPIDEDLADGILAADRRAADEPRPHREEHSLEMQLPFLQHLVPGLKIVPCLMGTQSRGEVDRLAAALAEAVGDRQDVVLVGSSDLSHYHPALVANRLDGVVVKDLEAFDPEGLMLRLEASHEHACGGGPMVCVMRAARSMGADGAVVLNYGDSGDVAEGDKSRVVGYVSAALYRSA